MTTCDWQPFPEGGWSLPRGVSGLCAEVISISSHISFLILFSCWRLHWANLTVKNTMEFISMNSLQVSSFLEETLSNHVLSIQFPQSLIEVVGESGEGGIVVCFTAVLSVMNSQQGSSSLMCALGDTVFENLSGFLVSCEKCLLSGVHGLLIHYKGCILLANFTK